VLEILGKNPGLFRKRGNPGFSFFHFHLISHIPVCHLETLPISSAINASVLYSTLDTHIFYKSFHHRLPVPQTPDQLINSLFQISSSLVLLFYFH